MKIRSREAQCALWYIFMCKKFARLKSSFLSISKIPTENA